MSKKVLVGLSGGVDSSTAIILLKKDGYEVEAVTFLFTEDSDANDAKKVCEKLNIKHHIVDYRKEFKEKIIDNFLRDYKNGITPNPCVLCNKTVKLKLLYEKMLEYGCDYIATGHYARIDNGNLYLSSDLNKDQTYFLCEVPKEILNRLLLPLEGIKKDEVRKLASDNALENASKKDSTDVCFINESFRDYMQKSVDDKSGNVIDIQTNKIIGKHNGLSHYTIGQRRGLNIGGSSDRMFVVGKNIKENILYVCIGEDSDYLISTSCIIENFNYLGDEKISKCQARFRYRQNNIDVELNYIDDSKVEVIYKGGAKAVTPGQACVLYDNNRCLGGGIIKEVYKDGQKLWYL